MDEDVLVVEVSEDMLPKEDLDEVFEIDDDIDIAEIIKDYIQAANVKRRMRLQLADAQARILDVETKCTSTNSLFETLTEQVKCVRNALDVGVLDDPNGIGDFTVANPSSWESLEELHIDADHPPASASTSQQSVKTYSRALASSGDLEVIADIRVKSLDPKLPSPGPVVRPEIKFGTRVYAMKASHFGVWYKAKVVEIKAAGDSKLYKVKFEPRKLLNQSKILSGKRIAYCSTCQVLIPVGTRVIAQYRDEDRVQPSSMYAGIIAEPPKQMNNFRYLVFFDDGYAQYIGHTEICLVCEVSLCVWDDIHPDSTEFIKNYLKEYPERPMVKLQAGQTVRTEWNGKWWVAEVVEVDASLAKMYFIADKRTEWIYRGSTRLGPLYSELANAEANKHSGKLKRHNLFLTKRKNAPYVEYTRGLDDVQEIDPQFCAIDFCEVETDEPTKRQVARKHTSPSPPHRLNVARKSTTLPPKKEQHFGTMTERGREYEGTFEIRTNWQSKPTRAFTPHECGPPCVADCDEDLNKFKGKNPFTVPMLIGWERQIVKHKSMGKRVVFYRCPCGVRCRSIEDVNHFLMVTKSKLTIDIFCMDSFVHVFGEFVPTKVHCYIRDISYGMEDIPVSCVNSISKEYPEYVEYSTKRMPHNGVQLNLDTQFLVGCDCTDECSDKNRCSCRQLTVEATKSAPGGGDRDVGYQFRRLTENVITGVYECNANCACSLRCLNRVAQNGLKLRLQVFKTEKRGWGLRCIDDVPQGAFICTYAGRLLTEQGANEGGTQFGDEYLAELDYIEVVEKLKEGYESDIVEPEDSPVQYNGAAEESPDSDKEKLDEEVNAPASQGDSGSEYEATRQTEDSSDSEFEANMGPIAPREHVTRNKGKVQKIVLQRGSKDSECEPGWLVRNQDECSTGPAGSADEESQSNAATPTNTPSKVGENSSASATPKKTPGKGQFNLRPLELSPKTLESLKKIQLQRVPKVAKDKKIEPIVSDSEDDNSKASRTSSADTGDDNPNTSKFPIMRSLFSALPDPKKTSEPRESNQLPGGVDIERNHQRRGARSYFGEEFCYIMDAKSAGNIGRYLNHSCSPNVFVQNVFVDAHDIRFPWVAFFASQYIRAGSELTWDYNYDVGSVDSKVMYCFCGSAECRGRLL